MQHKKIAWIVPNPIKGSGGHRTILQNANYLSSLGFEVDAYIEADESSSDKEIQNTIESYFGEMDVNFYAGYELKKEYDLIFATAWFTAKYVRDLDTSAKKAYFVQDYEALFNSRGDYYVNAKNSYRYGLMPITIGKWLTNLMISEFKSPSNYFDFCADLSVYRKKEGSKKEKAVCFIFQPEKPRRCNQLGLDALKLVKDAIPDVTIYLYGSEKEKEVTFNHRNLKLITINECNELYNRCMVGLCISTTNPSRVPFEMMASGLPVVDVYMENNLYDLPEEGVLLADTTAESIAQALIDLINDDERRGEMSVSGSEFMSNRDLQTGYEQFGKAVINILSNREYTVPNMLEKAYNESPVSVPLY